MSKTTSWQFRLVKISTQGREKISIETPSKSRKLSIETFMKLLNPVVFKMEKKQSRHQEKFIFICAHGTAKRGDHTRRCSSRNLLDVKQIFIEISVKSSTLLIGNHGEKLNKERFVSVRRKRIV